MHVKYLIVATYFSVSSAMAIDLSQCKKELKAQKKPVLNCMISFSTDNDAKFRTAVLNATYGAITKVACTVTFSGRKDKALITLIVGNGSVVTHNVIKCDALTNMNDHLKLIVHFSPEIIFQKDVVTQVKPNITQIRGISGILSRWLQKEVNKPDGYIASQAKDLINKLLLD